MTVGIAAITEYETDVPKVIVSADKMLTTRQQSAIEHEHPDTKLTSIAEDVPNVEILTVFAGSVSLAEELRNYIEQGLWELLDTIHEPDQPVNVNITNVAKVAGREVPKLGTRQN
ncbi:MAG: hypothetical protein U5K37_12465 [Natrialbaceae archaeon]|nr:hypothetical protein [Natrialbaceae archaeon]